MRAPLSFLITLSLLAAIAAGCGSGSAGSSTGTSPSGGGGTTSVHAQAVKFAECMRGHGVSAFPDPDATGSLTLDGVVNGSSIDPDGAAFTQAISACKQLEPAGFTGTKATPQQRSARLQFAQCVRQNGVPDFPDPTPNGPLVDTNRIPSSNTANGMSALNAAMQTCSKYSDAAGVKGSQ